MGRTKRTIAIVALTLAGCSGPITQVTAPPIPAITLHLYASTGAAPLMRDLASGYAQLNPQFAFTLTTSNYQGVIDYLLNGQASYVLTNYLPPDSPLWAAPVGQDGIAIITHPEVGLSDLSIEQLRGIYTGTISNYRDVGISDQEIVVFSREEGSGTRAEFEQQVMGARSTTRLALLAPSSAAMVESVARTPGSIGYVSMSYLNASVHTLSIGGVLPSRDTVFENRYPLRASLYVVGLIEPVTDYRAFIGWAQSLDGQIVVSRHYAPLLRP